MKTTITKKLTCNANSTIKLKKEHQDNFMLLEDLKDNQQLN